MNDGPEVSDLIQVCKRARAISFKAIIIPDLHTHFQLYEARHWDEQ